MFARVGLVVLAFAYVGILSPIVLLPNEVFGAAGPTLTGQYIFKNAVLIAAALVVASRVLRDLTRSADRSRHRGSRPVPPQGRPHAPAQTGATTATFNPVP